MASGKRDIPDLIPDLQPAPAKRPAPARPGPSRGNAPAARPSGPASGGGLDGDFELGSSISSVSAPTGSAPGAAFGDDDALELGSAHTGSGSTGPQAAGGFGASLDFGSGGSFDPDFDELEGSTTAAVETAARVEPKKRRAWPTGVTAEPDPTAFDARDILELSGFGEPPSNAALSPLYAVQVYQRRRRLQELARQATEELEARERARDEALGRMVRQLESELRSDERTERLLANVDRADAELNEQRGRLAGANAEFDRQRREIDQTLEAIDADIGTAEAVVEQKRAVEEGHRTTQKRLEAKEKRLFIELRPIADAIEKGSALSAAERQNATRLEAEIAALKPELDQARAAAEAAGRDRKDAEGAAAKHEKVRSDAERKKRAIEHSFGKHIGAETEHVKEAERARREALAAAGREVLAMRGTVAVPEPTVEALLGADRRVADQAFEHERHLRALDAFDPDAYKRGFMILAALGVAIIGVIIWALL